ncbi:HAD family hydrolase [Lutibaculum baratangense]|uniref:Putative phosphoglycolate phosphatase n=1 Tax=Lutibaculum baratangense AMV1 TaxID=631454 RepID=V4RJP6_9HYPH|nr:HAD family hydrolase [Lutibaculum baratangense]ESR23460.1 putative phosphoglycolate phosphatase [Lutibaculum baratangense AMV1]
MPIRGIVFDKDGTLIDYARTWVPINIRAARYAAAGDLDLEVRLLAVGGQDPQSHGVRGGSLLAAGHTGEIAEAWIAAGARHDHAGLVAALDEIFTQGAAGAVAVTDVATLFERLAARGLRLAVATSDSASGAMATLREIGLDRQPLFLAGYDSGHGGKPEAGMVLAFCREAGLAPGDVAVVGDNLHDIRMGRAAGCALCVGVLTGTATREELEAEADHVITGIDQLEALFDRLGVWPHQRGT